MSKFFVSFARLLGALMLVAATLLNAAPAAASSTNAPQGVKVGEISMPAPWPAIQVISLDAFPTGLQDVVVRDGIRIGKSREGFLVVERLGAGKALMLQTQCRADMQGGAQCAALGLTGEAEFVRHIPVEVPAGSVYMFFMGRFCAPYQFDLDAPFGYGVGVDADASKCGTPVEHDFTVSANPTCEGWAVEATSDEEASFVYKPAQQRGWQNGETSVVVTVTATFADNQTMTKSVTIDRPTDCGGGKEHDFNISKAQTCEGWAVEATSDEEASFVYKPAQQRGWQNGETSVVVTVTATFADNQTMTKSVTIDRPTDCGGGKDRSRIWPTGMPIVGCQALPQYGGEAVWLKAYSLIHINTENRPAGERWDVVQSSFSADGVNWTTTPTPTRVIGIESRSIPMEQVVWVNFLASQQNADVATFGDTHLLRDSLPGVDPLNYEQVRRLGFHIVHPDQPDRLLGPARKGTAADAEYEWAYKVNVARCAPKTDTPQYISQCVGRNPDGTKRYEEFPLGQEPEEAADCRDKQSEVKTYCERTVDGLDIIQTIDKAAPEPAHLPCTLGGDVNEIEAEALIASANQGALWATLAIFLIFFGVLIASRRRFASAKTR